MKSQESTMFIAPRIRSTLLIALCLGVAGPASAATWSDDIDVTLVQPSAPKLPLKRHYDGGPLSPPQTADFDISGHFYCNDNGSVQDTVDVDSTRTEWIIIPTTAASMPVGNPSTFTPSSVTTYITKVHAVVYPDHIDADTHKVTKNWEGDSNDENKRIRSFKIGVTFTDEKTGRVGDTYEDSDSAPIDTIAPSA